MQSHEDRSLGDNSLQPGYDVGETFAQFHHGEEFETNMQREGIDSMQQFVNNPSFEGSQRASDPTVPKVL
ncbi:MAG: hypothetical protein Fur0032_19120 [Terrimicrobiaceae bacterium]